MWHIDSPMKVFKNIFAINNLAEFSLNAILLDEKYNLFPEVR